MSSFALDFLPDYGDSAILEEMRRVAAAVGGSTLTVSEFSRHSKVGVTTVRRRFGSWPAALESAGLAHLYNRPAPAKRSRTLARTLTDDQLLAEIRRVSEIVGRSSVITADDLREHSTVGLSAFRNRFGTLKAAFLAAGLTVCAHGRRYTDEECFENLLEVWTHYGRAPAHDEMANPPSVVGPKAYTLRWRTWRLALTAFVARVDSPDVAPSEKPAKCAPERPRLRTEDRHAIPLSLRYRVLKRDSFRCVQCGCSPAIAVGVELHVDHLVAFTHGGKTIEANLRTLCKECNLGKGSSE